MSVRSEELTSSLTIQSHSQSTDPVFDALQRAEKSGDVERLEFTADTPPRAPRRPSRPACGAPWAPEKRTSSFNAKTP
jgi:hypothetical protein